MSTHSEATECHALLRALAALCNERPAVFVAWVVRRATRFQHEGQDRDEAYWAALAEVGVRR